MKSCREGDEGARYAAACELEATEANQQVVLGDGAEWIKTQAGQHFTRPVHQH